ncbi:PD-(D/E)XK nuclease family protein [bacterium]|nr:PD-(D/E)XK nuclease family protein [bacterium]MBU1636678.1 PD-(D/E)XK nuclease family protein [bacterium]
MIKYINQSLLNLHAKCGIAAEYRVSGLIIPPAAAAHRGTGVHRAAEADARRIQLSSDRLTIPELQDAAATAFCESVEKHGVYLSAEDAPQARVILGQAKDEAVRAAALYGERVSPRIGQPVHIEEEIVVQMDGLDYPLGGTLDLVHLVTAGYKITDLKTTGKAPDPSVATHSIQAPMYELLAERALGLKPSFEFEFIKLLKTKSETITIPAVFTPQTRANLLQRASVFEAHLQSGVFTPAAPGSWWCSESWCGYYGICAHGAKQSCQIAMSA